MAIDYNRLMKELDSCLGLESSATESVKRPSGPSKKRKAFEGYDDVDMEIIQAMKDSPEGASSEFSEEDLVYSDDNQDMPEADEEESPEVKLADSVDCLFNDYVQSGKTPQEAADSIKDLVESAVAELYDPDDEEAEADESMKDVVTPVKRVSCHSIANRSSTESNKGKSPSPEENKVINYIKKAFGDLYNSGLYGGSWEDLLGNESDEFREYGLDDEESIADYAETKMLGVPFKTKSQVMTLGKNIDKAYDIVQKYGEGVFSSGSSATESNSKTVDDDPYDPDAAFEALSSKMLNRYSQLTHRSQLKNKKSAEEGVSASEVKIDDNVIRRVSCEFAYSGENLRKMVAEAIKKGVI